MGTILVRGLYNKTVFSYINICVGCLHSDIVHYQNPYNKSIFLLEKLQRWTGSFWEIPPKKSEK